MAYKAGFLHAGWTGFWDDSGTSSGWRDTPRPIFRVTSRPIQECARPILERDEKSGRRTRTRTSSKQLQFTKIIEYPTTPPFFSAMSNEQRLPFSTANHPVLLSPIHANNVNNDGDVRGNEEVNCYSSSSSSSERSCLSVCKVSYTMDNASYTFRRMH